VKVDRLERVEIEIVTIEEDRVYANFFAWEGTVCIPLGGRAMFAGDHWPSVPVIRKIGHA
jgi:hypothetical protein